MVKERKEGRQASRQGKRERSREVKDSRQEGKVEDSGAEWRKKGERTW